MSNYPHENYGTASESDSLLKDDDDDDEDDEEETNDSRNYLRPRGNNSTNNINSQFLNMNTINNNNNNFIDQSYSESSASVNREPPLTKSNSNHSFSILQSHPKYSSTPNDHLNHLNRNHHNSRQYSQATMDNLLALSNHLDNVGVVSSRDFRSSTTTTNGGTFDYETLLTQALENTTREVDRDNKRKQNILLTIIICIFLFSICVLSTVTFSEYPEEKELKEEIHTLENEIDTLHNEVDTFTKDEDIDLLKKDIDDKKAFIVKLEHDDDIDPIEKEALIKSYERQIHDLKIVVHELEQNRSGGVGNVDSSVNVGAGASAGVDTSAGTQSTSQSSTTNDNVRT